MDRAELVEPVLSVHSFLRRSAANGPGIRAVVWTQGCSIGCKGCFNPGTHGFPGGTPWRPSELARLLVDTNVDGLTVSGGEPLDQWEGTLALLQAWRQIHPGTVVVLTGHTWERILARRLAAEIERLQALVDVLIAGPYLQSHHLGSGLRGSSNKTIHSFSRRHTVEEIDSIPSTEVVIQEDGSLIATGVHPLRIGRHAV